MFVFNIKYDATACQADAQIALTDRHGVISREADSQALDDELYKMNMCSCPIVFILNVKNASLDRNICQNSS